MQWGARDRESATGLQTAALPLSYRPTLPTAERELNPQPAVPKEGSVACAPGTPDAYPPEIRCDTGRFHRIEGTGVSAPGGACEVVYPEVKVGGSDKALCQLSYTDRSR